MADSIEQLASASPRHLARSRPSSDLAVESDLDLFFVQAAANQDQDRVLEFLRHPHAIPTFSDSGAHVSQIMDSSLQTHMLGHWVRDQPGVHRWKQAVHRMTQVPARVWGFDDRGVVAPGMAADLNVFDLATDAPPTCPSSFTTCRAAPAGYVRPPSGIAATIVNGEVLVADGEPTGARPGRLLRRGAAAS